LKTNEVQIDEKKYSKSSCEYDVEKKNFRKTQKKTYFHVSSLLENGLNKILFKTIQSPTNET
jgi:hypothetical protein